MTKARSLADLMADGNSLSDGVVSVAEVSGAAPLASPSFTGDISVTGTVDGRDVAADGTKLDGVEAGATADQTKADIDALNINADTLDGKQLSTIESEYQAFANTAANTAAANVVDSAPGTLDTLNELAAALGDDANFSTTVTNSIATKMPLAGGTFTGNVTFGDNDKAIFGAGSDLQIYHDGSHSYVKDNGTGDLILQASDDVKIQTTSGTNMAVFTEGTYARLFYNGSAKFETTSSGITVTGDATATNFNTTSDATLKTNVETLTGSLDAVKAMRGVSFDWLDNGGSEIGVIAQEVEAVLPDVVSTNDEGIKSVKYGNIVAVLIEAIKEQQLRIEALEAQLNS